MLSFQACSNEDSEIKSELRNYSNPTHPSDFNSFTASGRHLKQSGSLQFLTGEKIIFENFSYFFTLDSLIYQNDYKRANALWKPNEELRSEKNSEIDHLTQIENDLLHFKIKFNLKDYISAQEIIAGLNLEWKQKDFVSQFYFLEKLQQQASVWYSTGSYQASLSALCYGLHLIETSFYSESLLRQKANLHFQKANVMMNERGLEMQESANESLEIAKTVFEKIGDKLSVQYILVNQANILSQQGNLEEAIKLINSLDTLNEDKNYLVYLYLNKGYLSYENGDTKSAIRSYEVALSHVQGQECNNRLEYLYEYLFDCYLEEQDFETAEKYLNRLLNTEVCDDSAKPLTEFYNTSSLFRLYQSKYFKNKKDEDQLKAYEFGMNYRSLAKSLFGKEDELHLGDLYVENASDILGLFDGNKVITKDSPTWKMVMDIVFDSKKLTKVSSDKSAPEATEAQTPSSIIQAITTTNDFKYNSDFSPSSYKSIYQHFVSSTDTKQILDSGIKKPPSKESNIEVFELSNPHLAFIAHSDICWKVYIDSDSEITIEKLALDTLSALSERYLASIIDRKEDLEIKKRLAELILPRNLDEISQLTILPDDIVQNLPFGAFLSIPHHIDFGFRPASKPIVSAINASIFSYSDEESIKSLEEKEFVELASGLQEAYEVREILGLTQNIIKDEAFNKGNFKKQLVQDIIHVSSHAVVKSTIRKNCFLLLNKEDGSLDSLYMSEISAFDDVPSFLYMSTCNSGIGYTLQGNGKYSLSQSFMEKGTQTILSTLWPVDDQVTRAFSIKYYQNWLQNKSAEEALRNTQLEFIEDSMYQQPYFWAGFILEGNGNMRLEK